jgi:phosphoglycerate dehydrogenase-like enzyme
MLHNYGQQPLTQLRDELVPGVEVTVGTELPEPAAYEILVGGRPKREHLAASPNLRALIVPWSGVPDTTRELMREFPNIPVHNLHYNQVPVAEMAIALLLAVAKKLVPMDRSLRAHDWAPRYRPEPSLLLEGRTALILGYGAIGQRVANLCRALGMDVLTIRRNPKASDRDDPTEIHPPEALHRLLSRADALLVCLPHTEATDGLIGAEELALLPPQALLVNIGRGPIVDEAALYRALSEGKLFGAGLDVWYNYPSDEEARRDTPPSDYPFHALDSVVMSPHRGGAVQKKEALRMTHLARLLNAAAQGQQIPNRVDLALGY